MIYKYTYKTPKQFSNIIMNSDGEYLTGLWFEGSRDTSKHELNCEEKEFPIFKEVCKWLNIYFSGKNPDFTPKYKIDNLTTFRKEVVDIMNSIKYGKLLTYNDISRIIANIVPCHRVVGTNGNLIGYGGGINNKIELLKLEGIDMSKYFIPKRGTAL